MSTLAEIEAAIERLPAPELDELALWLERRRSHTPVRSAAQPDFLGRARAIWGDTPAGVPLSAVVAEARD